MDFNMIDNMNTHLRTMELKTMWSMRKKNNDYSSKGQLRLDQMYEQMYSPKNEDQKMSNIAQKVYNGAKLTQEEMEYLRVKNPQLYNELVQEEQEQKAFEKDLRRCETKEDVERLKMNKINGALSTISSVENNPNIPKAKKLEIIMKVKRRMDAVEESCAKFVKSGEFAKLPTEAEETLARKEEAEQKKTEQTPPEQESKPVQKGEEEADGTEETGQAETTENPKPVSKTEASADKTIPTDTAPDLPKPEIDLESPEERKVRRARAKAAYAALSPDFEPKSSSAKLDRNA